MVAMFGGDDTFIAPKTFQLFDYILEQSKVWSKSIIFQEGLPSQFNKSETYIDLSSHLSNSYADPYLSPTMSGFNLVIRTEKGDWEN